MDDQGRHRRGRAGARAHAHALYQTVQPRAARRIARDKLFRHAVRFGGHLEKPADEKP